MTYDSSIKLKANLGHMSLLTVSDINDRYICGLNNPSLNVYLESRHTAHSFQSCSDFVKLNHSLEHTYLFGYWHNSQLVATARIYPLPGADFNKASIGIFIFEPSLHGKGLGTDLIKCLSTWTLNSTHFNQIEAGIYPDNIGSIKAFLKAGYLFSHQNIATSLLSQPRVNYYYYAG